MLYITFDNAAVLLRLEQGLPSSMAVSLNKVMNVGLSMHILDLSCVSPVCGMSL